MHTTPIKTWVFVYVKVSKRTRIPWGWCACVNSGAQAVSSPPSTGSGLGMRLRCSVYDLSNTYLSCESTILYAQVSSLSPHSRLDQYQVSLRCPNYHHARAGIHILLSVFQLETLCALLLALVLAHWPREAYIYAICIMQR